MKKLTLAVMLLAVLSFTAKSQTSRILAGIEKSQPENKITDTAAQKLTDLKPWQPGGDQLTNPVFMTSFPGSSQFAPLPLKKLPLALEIETPIITGPNSPLDAERLRLAYRKVRLALQFRTTNYTMFVSPIIRWRLRRVVGVTDPLRDNQFGLRVQIIKHRPAVTR